MDDLEQKSLEFAERIMNDYAPLLVGCEERNLRLVLQRTYMEGYAGGLQKSHENALEVVNKVLGGK